MKANNTSKESRTDWNRLKNLPDSDIDFSEVPKLSKSFFNDAKVRLPKRKKAVSLRLDPDVLDWFKQEGKGYQTMINAVLRAYVEAHQH
jgi:uncharacterized protein (DUF4415 family)